MSDQSHKPSKMPTHTTLPPATASDLESCKTSTLDEASSNPSSEQDSFLSTAEDDLGTRIGRRDAVPTFRPIEWNATSQTFTAVTSNEQRTDSVASTASTPSKGAQNKHKSHSSDGEGISPRTTIVSDPTSVSSRSTPDLHPQSMKNQEQQHCEEIRPSYSSSCLSTARNVTVQYTAELTDATKIEHVYIEQVFVVRNEEIQGEDVKNKTSIWTRSKDGCIRLEQRRKYTAPDQRPMITNKTLLVETRNVTLALPDYDDPCKIVVPIQVLAHRCTNDDLAGRKEADSMTYIFSCEEDCIQFQQALFGCTLLASFKTKKTIRVHETLHLLCPDEQMCDTKVLRVWRDEDSGAIILTIRYAKSYRLGPMIFCLNDKSAPLSLVGKDCDQVTFRGLQTMENQFKPLRKRLRRCLRVLGIKETISVQMEFDEKEEKTFFMNLVRMAQYNNMIEIPDELKLIITTLQQAQIIIGETVGDGC